MARNLQSLPCIRHRNRADHETRAASTISKARASAWNRRYSQRLVASFVVLALILAAVAVQVYRAVGEFVATNHWVTHSLEVKQEITLTLASLHDIEASQRAYIISGKRRAPRGLLPRLPAGDRAQRAPDRPGGRRSEQAANGRPSCATLIEQRIDGINAILSQYAKGGIECRAHLAARRESLEEDHRIDAARQGHDPHGGRSCWPNARQRIEDKAGLTRMLTTGAVLVCLAILTLALVALLREERRRLISDARVNSANVELTHEPDKSQDLARTLRQLSELGEMLQGCRSMDEATGSLQISLPHLLSGTSGSISLINASKNLLEPIASLGHRTVLADSPCFRPMTAGHCVAAMPILRPERCRRSPANTCIRMPTRPSMPIVDTSAYRWSPRAKCSAC